MLATLKERVGREWDRERQEGREGERWMECRKHNCQQAWLISQDYGSWQADVRLLCSEAQQPHSWLPSSLAGCLSASLNGSNNSKSLHLCQPPLTAQKELPVRLKQHKLLRKGVHPSQERKVGHPWSMRVTEMLLSMDKAFPNKKGEWRRPEGILDERLFFFLCFFS